MIPDDADVTCGFLPGVPYSLSFCHEFMNCITDKITYFTLLFKCDIQNILCRLKESMQIKYRRGDIYVTAWTKKTNITEL